MWTACLGGFECDFEYDGRLGSRHLRDGQPACFRSPARSLKRPASTGVFQCRGSMGRRRTWMLVEQRHGDLGAS
jgi:hypothetical protein